MRIATIRLSLLLAFFSWFAGPGRIISDDGAETETVEPLPLAFMSPDCIGLLRLAPARLLESSLLSAEKRSAVVSETPLRLDDLDEAVIWLVLEDSVEGKILGAPDTCFAFRFNEPTEVAEVREAWGYAGDIQALDETTIICAKAGLLEQLQSRRELRSPLADSIRDDQLDADVYIAFQLVSDAYTVDWSGYEQLLFGMGDLGITLMDLTQVQFALRSDESPFLKIWLEFSEEEIAEGYAGILKEQLPLLIAIQTQDETVGGLMRQLTDAWSVAHSGRVVSFEVAHSDELVTEFANLIDAITRPAVMSNPSNRPETRAINNLKLVLLASHNYEEAYSRFPVQDNGRYLDEDGRPFLSWRVHVLPMLDQQELYDQFHLDEPWDSEHNLELLEKMPAVYADPMGEVEDETLTRVVRFDVDADWAPFPNGVGGRIHGFLDGTSNSIYCIFAGADKSVPWTKPEDLTIDLDEPVIGQLGEINQDFVIVGMVDGAVRRLPLSVDNEVFLNLINPRDGNHIPEVFE